MELNLCASDTSFCMSDNESPKTFIQFASFRVAAIFVLSQGFYFKLREFVQISNWTFEKYHQPGQ